jgi:hypothetical protein
MSNHVSASLALLALLLAAGGIMGQAPNDPAAWYRLDETTGTVASDSGPNGNDGTLTGFVTPLWTPAQFGNGLQFNGTSNYINVPVGNGLPVYNRGRYSVTFWVNAPPQGDRRVYSEGDSASLTPLFTLGSGGNSTTPSGAVRVFVRADNGGNRIVAQSVAPAFDNTWHHVAWVDNNGLGRLYIDGVLDSTLIYDAPVLTLSRASVGAVLRASPGNFLTGSVDDLRVFPYCLTPVDVQLIFVTNNPVQNLFQVNQDAARLEVDGIPGSPGFYAEAEVAQAATFTLEISSTNGGLPWEIAGTLIPPVPSFLPLTQNILNIDITHPTLVLLNNGFQTPWGSPVSIPGLPPTNSTVSLTQTITAPSSPGALSLQFGIADPSSPDGLHLSAPVRININ